MNQPYKRHYALKGIYDHLRQTRNTLERAAKVDVNGARGILLVRAEADALIEATRTATDQVQALLEHFSEWDSGVTGQEIEAKAAAEAVTELDDGNTDSGGRTTQRRKSAKP